MSIVTLTSGSLLHSFFLKGKLPLNAISYKIPSWRHPSCLFITEELLEPIFQQENASKVPDLRSRKSIYLSVQGYRVFFLYSKLREEVERKVQHHSSYWFIGFWYLLCLEGFVCF